MWLIPTALMAVSPLGNQHWSRHPHHPPTCQILKSSDIKLHFWSRGIIINKVTDKLLLQTEPLNSILALGYVSHKYGELSGYKINSKHRPCSWQALYCTRCLSINRNITVSRWHFIIWSWRVPLNTSHLYRLICSPLLSNIYHNLIYIGKTPPFPWWDGHILLMWTGFICIAVLVAIHFSFIKMQDSLVYWRGRGRKTTTLT